MNFYRLIKEHQSKQFTYIHKFKANFTAEQTSNYFLKLNEGDEENAKYCNFLITFYKISELGDTVIRKTDVTSRNNNKENDY